MNDIPENHILVRIESDNYDNEYGMTVEQGRDLIRQIRSRIYALKRKCPTCRCLIIPWESCMCCGSSCGEELEPIV